MRALCSVALALMLTPQTVPPRPAAAGLQATIRMSVEKTDAPLVTPEGKPSPYGNFGPLVAQLLTPNGPVSIVYTIAGDQSRAEVQGRLAVLPEGSVVLQKVGEDVIRVLNPSNKTWYEIPASQNLGTLLGAPAVTIEPTKETATIAGQPAERFRFSETLHVPVPEGTTLPAGIPSDLQLSGDLWSTDAFAGSSFTSVFRTLQAFAAIPGVEALTAGDRFPLRIILRSSVMPGYEIHSEVTSIATASPDASLFAVPAGYQKVMAPIGAGGENSATPQRPTTQ